MSVSSLGLEPSLISSAVWPCPRSEADHRHRRLCASPLKRPKRPRCCWCLWWECVSCRSECGTVWYWRLLQAQESISPSGKKGGLVRRRFYLPLMTCSGCAHSGVRGVVQSLSYSPDDLKLCIPLRDWEYTDYYYHRGLIRIVTITKSNFSSRQKRRLM